MYVCSPWEIIFSEGYIIIILILALHQQPKGVRNCNFYISNLAEALQVLANHISEISQPAFGFWSLLTLPLSEWV